RKSSVQKFLSTFTTRKESWWSSRTAGRKVISQPRTLFQTRPAVISSLSQSRSHPKNGPIGRSFTGSVNAKERDSRRGCVFVMGSLVARCPKRERWNLRAREHYSLSTQMI